jgi:hypothetical protein
MSDFGGTHTAFRLMNTCAVRHYGFLLRTLPHDISRPNLVAADIAVRTTTFRILDVSQGVQTLDQLNCAKRQLSLPAEFGGLNVPSLELDAEPAHYASFPATLANLIIDYESDAEPAHYASFPATLANLIIDYESEGYGLIGPMYGLIRQEILNVATSTLSWVVQLRSSYDTISTMGGFSESGLVVLTNTLNQDLSDYAGPMSIWWYLRLTLLGRPLPN